MPRRRKQLRFSKEYVDSLLSGEKRSTIRLSTNLKPGDIVDLVVKGEKLGQARVIDIVRKSYRRVSDHDARVDGFKSKKELTKALKKHYPWFKGANEDVFIIYFKMMGQDRKKNAKDKSAEHNKQH